MDFRNLIDVIKRLGGRYPSFSHRFEEAEALGRWQQAVGKSIAQKTRPVRVKEGVLYVEVNHPIWKTELHHRKAQILETLNQSFDEKMIIEDIYFFDSMQSTRKSSQNHND